MVTAIPITALLIKEIAVKTWIRNFDCSRVLKRVDAASTFLCTKVAVDVGKDFQFEMLNSLHSGLPIVP